MFDDARIAGEIAVIVAKVIDIDIGVREDVVWRAL